MHVPYLIVGAGLTGITLGQRLATETGKQVLIIDKRSHIGGNCFDMYDEHGVLIHPYGPHYFRTDSPRVVDYLSRFTDWHPVCYKVRSYTRGTYWSFPVNLHTYEQLIGRRATEEEFIDWLTQERVPADHPAANSEELMLQNVGPTLFSLFFAPYTLKQWGRPASELAPSVCGRIPIRTNRDDSYLRESFQALPAEGYTRMMQAMLDSAPNLSVRLSTAWQDIRESVTCDRLIFTGPVDEYFDYRLGYLPYRSLRFEREHYAADKLTYPGTPDTDPEFYQPEMQVNYPDPDIPWTRIVELKHATGQRINGSTIIREYPDDWSPGKAPYYPVPNDESRRLANEYHQLTKSLKHVTFIGRLAQYQYLNMDQVVLNALTCANNLIAGE